MGFRLNNKIKVLGPMAIFPRSVLSWNVCTVDDINEDSLSLFWVLEPKIEILVIGVGEEQVTPALANAISTITRKHKINTEILPTEQVINHTQYWQ